MSEQDQDDNMTRKGRQPSPSSRGEGDGSPVPQTRQSAESALVALRALVDCLYDAVFLLDADGVIEYANAAAHALSPRRGAVAGKPLPRVLGGRQNRRHAALIRQVSANGTELRECLLHVYRDGDRWLDVHYSPFQAATPRPMILAQVRDVTAEREADEQLRQTLEERELLYRAGAELGRSLDLGHIFTTMRSMIAERLDCDVLYLSSFDADSEMITCLFAWQDGHPMEIAGFPPVKLAPEGKGTQSLVIRTGQPLLLNDYNQQRRTSTTAYYVSKQGKAQRLASTEMPEEDPNVPNSAIFVPIKLGEHVRGVMQVFSYHLNAYRQRDLRLVEAIGTQVLVAVNNALLYQKVRQELIARRESEERFRQLAENINEVFWMYDLQIERLTYISPVYETIWPHTAQQAMANPELRYDVILEEDRAQVRATHLRPQHGERAAIEYRLAGADGEIYWMLDQAFPVFDENNAVTRIAGISANITKRKVAEQELRRREAEFKALVENSPDYVARLDPSGRFLYVNPAIAQNAGRALAEFVGKRPGEINLPIDVANLAKLPATVKPLTRIIEIPAGDGETRYVQIRLVPELDGEGRLQSWLSIARDLTDLITAQSKLEELNRTLEQRVVERTKSLAETQRIAHLGSLEVDLERHVAMLSEEAWRILRLQPQPDGLPLEQLSAMVHPDDRERIAEYYANRFEDNVHELEVRIARADGRAAYVSMRAKPIVEDGLVVRVLCTALDITERRMAEQEQRRQTAILEATTDLVAYWNQAGQITYMNAGGRRMLGIAPEVEVASVKLESILTPGGWETLRTEAIERAQRNGIWAGESAIVHAEGMEIPVSQVVIAHRDHNGAVEYFSTIMRDTTLQKQAEEALRRSRDELSAANTALEKAARLKDEFLASMSHELRTPLTSILGLAEALQSKVYGPLNEKQSHSIATMAQSGQHLLDLINDILDLSKIEAGQFELHTSTCSVDEICMASLQMIKGMAQQKHQSVGFTINPTAIDIEADQRRMIQILVNLLSNAVKFTPEEGRLGLDVQGDPSAGIVSFRIWDEGIGIDQADFPRLFQPFTQLDARLARHYAGSGLGLSLVRRMAELHGGSVTVESIVGAGSVFTVNLPWHSNTLRRLDRLRGPAREVQRTHDIPTPALDNPAVVMLVDDNLQTMETYVDYLRSVGFSVKQVADAVEALRLIPQLRPNVVLMDIQMPGMDGLEAIRRVRAWREPELSQTPIIALTALAMPGDRERCIDAGATEYLAKPVSMLKVAEMVERFLAAQ